jgi:hypothetical protein
MAANGMTKVTEDYRVHGQLMQTRPTTSQQHGDQRKDRQHAHSPARPSQTGQVYETSIVVVVVGMGRQQGGGESASTGQSNQPKNDTWSGRLS